jgi:hypothetical protein
MVDAFPDLVAQRDPPFLRRPVLPVVGVPAVVLDPSFPDVAVDVVAEEGRPRDEGDPPDEGDPQRGQEPPPGEPGRGGERAHVGGEGDTEQGQVSGDPGRGRITRHPAEHAEGDHRPA